MSSKPGSLGVVHKVLMLLVIFNIVGDFGNVVLWWSNTSSQLSLLNGYLSVYVVGATNALVVGTIILVAVSVVFLAALVGLIRKMIWAPRLVIVISLVNRVLGAFLYPVNTSQLLWVTWTIILVAFAFLDLRKIKALAKPLA